MGTDDRQSRLNERLRPYKRADDRMAWLQLATTGALFVGTWWAMLVALEVGWWLTLLLAPFAAGFSIRLFIFQHDCGHGSFFSTRTANDNVGVLLGVITLMPYHWWKKSHAIHHATSGDLDRRSLGDITTLTVAEYKARSRWRRLTYRLYRNPLVMLILGPFYTFVLEQRLPIGTPLSWRREWRSVLLTDAALLAVVAVMWQTIGLKAFLMVQLPIVLISGAAGVWLFYVQHQFEGTYWSRGGEWSFIDAALEGSSFYDLPAVLHWFTGNIGYHHVHHLASHIPNYKLPACFREVEELQAVPRLTLRNSLGCLRLKLWDEEAGRLVGFAAAGAPSAGLTSTAATG